MKILQHASQLKIFPEEISFIPRLHAKGSQWPRLIQITEFFLMTRIAVRGFDDARF